MHTAYASEITTTYTTGQVLTATTLDEIKNAVNDNNTRISTNATTPGPAGIQGLTGAVGATGAASTVVGPVGPAGPAGSGPA